MALSPGLMALLDNPKAGNEAPSGRDSSSPSDALMDVMFSRVCTNVLGHSNTLKI